MNLLALPLLLFTFAVSASICLAEETHVCTHGKSRLSPIQDFSYHLAEQVVLCKDGAFLVRFQGDGKELRFVGTLHGPQPTNAASFQFIRKAFESGDSKPPQVAVVELMESRLPMVKACVEDGFRNCIEMYFAVHLAQVADIPVILTEPSHKEFIDYLKPDYDKHDYACFGWLTRLAHPHFRNLLLGKKNEARQTLERTQKMFDQDLGIQFTLADFRACYREKIGHDVNFSKLTSDDYRPDTNGTYFQKMMYKMDILRNERKLSSILTSLEKHGRVAVILGWSHFVNLHKALVVQMGKPKFECTP